MKRPYDFIAFQEQVRQHKRDNLIEIEILILSYDFPPLE